MGEEQQRFMRQAIELSKANVRVGKGGPFAALVVRDNVVIAQGTNLVTSTNDPTAHAEIVAIREACRQLGTFQLSGCDFYTTCEPCPMCLGAIYWARPRAVYFANSQDDAAAIGCRNRTADREVSFHNAGAHRTAWLGGTRLVADSGGSGSRGVSRGAVARVAGVLDIAAHATDFPEAGKRVMVLLSGDGFSAFDGARCRWGCGAGWTVAGVGDPQERVAGHTGVTGYRGLFDLGHRFVAGVAGAFRDDDRPVHAALGD